MAKASTPERLYVGTMNDGLFIINRPPRPAPVDHLTEGDPETEVVATVHRNDLDLARKMAAAPELLAAAKTVLAGLQARIDVAPRDAVPVFEGIAALADAIARAEG